MRLRPVDVFGIVLFALLLIMAAGDWGRWLTG